MADTSTNLNSGSNANSNPVPNPTTSIGAFLIITIIYFVIKYKYEKTPTQNLMFFIIYLFILLLFIYFLNLHLTVIICGTAQVKTSLIVTFFPWLIIFGLLQVALMYYPGWLIPFSNTFGYGIAKLAGLTKKFSAVIKTPDGAPKGSSLRKILDTIYHDQSLLINEIPNADTGFDTWWRESMSGGLIKNNPKPKLEEIDALRKLIKLKNIVSKFIWFTLTGLLTISASYNYIIKSACNQTVIQMEERHNEYEKMVEEEEKNAPPRTTYYSYE
jgi:hypothetical protein